MWVRFAFGKACKHRFLSLSQCGVPVLYRVVFTARNNRTTFLLLSLIIMRGNNNPTQQQN